MRTDSTILKELSQLTNPDYKLFAEYCHYLDKGLRKDALKNLDNFLNAAKYWDTLKKIEFCQAIFSLSKPDNDFDIILKESLRKNLIEETLLEMTKLNPNDFSAFKWYGQFFRSLEFLKKAFELNPTNLSTAQILVTSLEYDLWFSTHHLPEGYLGIVEDDLENIKLGLSICINYKAGLKYDYTTNFNRYKTKIELYLKS